MAQEDPELLAALQAAHDAGDTESAMKIAELMNATPVTPQQRPQPVSPSPADQPGGEHWMEKYGPTSGMSGGQKFAAGMGQSVYDLGRGVSQMFGGMTPAEVDAQRKQDEPLDHGYGLAGNIVGSGLSMAIPGMGAEAAGAKIASMVGTSPAALAKAASVYRYMRPLTEGAAMGATGTVGTGESRAGNTAIGGAAGAVGGALGSGVNSVLRAGTDNISKGARIGADIADKYGIPLSMPDLAGGSLGWVQSALDKLPFSGAQGRADAQRSAFNNALGKTAGIPDADGAITQDMMAHAQDTIGDGIGQIASAHSAVPTTKNLTNMMDVLREAQDTGTEEHAAAVRDKITQLLSKVDPATGTIPGDAWRVQNTALGRQIRSTTDGDMKHYLGALQEPYMDMMEQGIPPQLLDTFQGLRGQYRNIKTLQPLAEKAGNVGADGINPTLVQGRAIAAGNTNGDVKELGDFAKTYLTKKYPDSGTAQRALLYSTLGGLGAIGNEVLGGPEGGHQHEGSALWALAPALVGELAGGQASRILGSRLLSKYYTAQLPDAVAQGIRGVTSTAPAAAARSAQLEAPSAPAPEQPEPDQGMADGGQPEPQYKKSTFWDLVQQAIKEVTGGNNGMVAAPQSPAPGISERASGPVGADFDRSIDAGVSANE